MSPRPHNLLIVGLGPSGMRHLRAFQATGRVQLAICDADSERRLRAMREYGADRAYASLDEALRERHDVGVVIGPVPERFRSAVRMMEHRLHVLIEPPLGLSLEGSDELLAMARRMRRVAATGYLLRAHPALIAMRKAVVDGQFGRPLQVLGVDARRLTPSDQPDSADGRVSHKTGGGAIQRGLSRLMNAAQWLVGSMDYLIADAERQVLDDVPVEDTVHVIARHGRIMAEYAANQHQSMPEVFLSVTAEHGCCRFDRLQNRWGYLTGGASAPEGGGGGASANDLPEKAPATEAGAPGAWRFEASEQFDDEQLTVLQAEAFLDAVDGIRPPLCTLEEGVQTLRATLAALESARTHARQPIEPGRGVGWG